MVTVEVIFYIFSVMTIIGALMVISSGNPVKAALSVVFTFASAAGVWITCQAVYLALLLIVVYVGAVMVMFLFVVMMLDVDMAAKRGSFVKHWPFALLLSVVLAVLLIWLVRYHNFASPLQYATLAQEPAAYNDIANLGMAMFTTYLFPFELAAFVLLAAMIAAITLTFRGRKKDNKSVDASQQIKVNPKDRLRIVKMTSVKKEQ
ncbi:MAG: NADH-quinone oxidoreductase subunit J [Francisellaceae bacterium]|jgi:NADH-quinone oxidoreductase subunit J